MAWRIATAPLLGLAVAVTAAVLVGQALFGPAAVGGVQSPFDRFPGPATGYGPARSVPGAPDPQTALVKFVGFVFEDVQRSWQRDFEKVGAPYQPAELVIFRQAVSSGCGPASAETGPFYCPADQRVYLDLNFFAELALRFQAPGDFAQAYVIAHEVAHHVQTLTGVTQEVQLASAQRPELTNALSIRQELQADCLAGVWAHSTYERGLLESGDLEEGLAAAAAVGDDRIQAETTGRIDPETWTHGSSEDRVRWFRRGFEEGDATACDTFDGDVDVDV